MRRYRPFIGYIIFGLIAIGILSQVIQNPRPLLIPLVVFGVIFYLYKFPPTRFRKRSKSQASKYKAAAVKTKTKTHKKTTSLRVIRGNKRDDDNEPPKYH